jgi:hypothetical protein
MSADLVCDVLHGPDRPGRLPVLVHQHHAPPAVVTFLARHQDAYRHLGLDPGVATDPVQPLTVSGHVVRMRQPIGHLPREDAGGRVQIMDPEHFSGPKTLPCPNVALPAAELCQPLGFVEHLS